MPFYGSIAHFKEAVNSVLAQEDPDWRLVIVDDVYPDLSAGDWANAIIDPRVSYIRNDVNLKPSKNYIKCVGLMESDFAVLMGCDDVMLPGYVGRVKQLTALFPECSILQPGVEVINGESELHRPIADRAKAFLMPREPRPLEMRGEDLATSLLRGNWTYFPSIVWRVSELRRHGFRKDLDVVQDLSMLLEIAKSGGSLVLDDRLVFQYRRHGASYSAVTGPDGSKFIQERQVFSETNRACKELGWTSAARASRIHLSSRMNALSELPAAVMKGSSNGRKALLRHVFGKSD
jgi:hypothetical protein